MSWDCRLSRLAIKQFKRIPRDRQEQLGKAIEKMTVSPTAGDVRPVKSGKFKSAFRKRLGSYRIIFSLAPANRLVEIAAFLYRTDTTYN